MALLPAEFAELEPFADWILPTERERYAKRLASTMDEMQAFYDAAFPLLDRANAYLEAFGMDSLPDPERNYLYEQCCQNRSVRGRSARILFCWIDSERTTEWRSIRASRVHPEYGRRQPSSTTGA